MPGLIVSPTLGTSRVTEKAFLTVPREIAVVKCDCVRGARQCEGLLVRNLPLTSRGLELYASEMGKKFVDRLEVRGYTWLGEIRMHGPVPSMEFNQHLADIESSAWDKARRQERGDGVYEDPSSVLDMVWETDPAGPYMDYYLFADFLVKNTLTEIVVKDADDGK